MEKDSWNFQICHFTLGNCRQNEAKPLEIPQNCVTINWNLQGQKPRTMEFHMISSGLPHQQVRLLFVLTLEISSFYLYIQSGARATHIPNRENLLLNFSFSFIHPSSKPGRISKKNEDFNPPVSIFFWNSPI